MQMSALAGAPGRRMLRGVDTSHRQRHTIGSPAAFRPQAKQYALHPLERGMVAVVIALLIFLPWALGGMKLWSQWTALALAALAFIIALVPRKYDDRYHAGGSVRLLPWPRLLRFPVFWLGLYIFGRAVTGQHPLFGGFPRGLSRCGTGCHFAPVWLARIKFQLNLNLFFLHHPPRLPDPAWVHGERRTASL
jgi:hypothetical protein